MKNTRLLLVVKRRATAVLASRDNGKSAVPRRMGDRKRVAYWTRKIGVM
jgi:hypothetical protein